MDLDVIIVSHNTRADLEACLTALHAQPPRTLGRIVVVDNMSADGSVDAVRTRWPAVRIVALDRNVGFAAANNLALRDSTAALALLLNSDAVAPPGAIDTLVDRLVATGAVAAGPRLVDERGRPEISFGPMLSPLAELLQRTRVRLAAGGGRLARRYVSWRVSRERSVDWVSGACLLVRRTAALEAGLLDERFFMYEEDVDFCAALRARGGRVLFTPAAEVLHRRGQSVRQTGTDIRAIYDRSHLLFYDKHLPRWARVLRWWKRSRYNSTRASSD